jgi:hypothetical protein
MTRVVLAVLVLLLGAGCTEAATRTVTASPATVTRTSTAPSIEAVYVPVAGVLVKKPTMIGVEAGNVIENIKWLAYAGDVARGKGIESCRNASPSWWPTRSALRGDKRR